LKVADWIAYLDHQNYQTHRHHVIVAGNVEADSDPSQHHRPSKTLTRLLLETWRLIRTHLNITPLQNLVEVAAGNEEDSIPSEAADHLGSRP
jgi:hypothetical protein